MEFEEHEEQDNEELAEIQQLPPNYDNSSSRGRMGERKIGGGYRYRECLKNHAVNVGGHALDGCGEFMAAGDDGTLDALKCAACNCHRNFHRKEPEGAGQFHGHQQVTPPPGYYHHHHRQPAGYLHVTPPPPTSLHQRPLALPSTSREDQEDMSNPSSSGGGGGGSGSKKRFRTKFTTEQKEKMLGFAERIGWRIQKQEEAAVQQFCAETGVKRQVLKVWMHNNKHTLEEESVCSLDKEDVIWGRQRGGVGEREEVA